MDAVTVSGIEVRTVRSDDVWRWLRAGWTDLRPRPATSLGLFVAALGCAAIALPLPAGFMFGDPLIAVGLHGMSRRCAEGRPFRLPDALGAVQNAASAARGPISRPWTASAPNRPARSRLASTLTRASGPRPVPGIAAPAGTVTAPPAGAGRPRVVRTSGLSYSRLPRSPPGRAARRTGTDGREGHEMAGSIGKDIVAVRDRWHTKNHPFFRKMLDGSLELRALGLYMAGHYKFVELALPSFGFLLWKAPEDVRRSVIENLAEETGLVAIPRPGHEPHDHNRMIFDFCNAAGLSDDDVRGLEIGPAWHARRLHYAQVVRDEPLGVALAMQSTQEGQQPELNREVTIPALVEHYGFARDAREIAFFVEHAEADEEHSERQMQLCEKYLTAPGERDRAIRICEEACMLRWESISEIHREHVLGQERILPPALAA